MPKMHLVFLIVCFLKSSHAHCVKDVDEDLLRYVIEANARRVLDDKIMTIYLSNFKKLAILNEDEQYIALSTLYKQQQNRGLPPIQKKLFDKLFSFTSTAIKHLILGLPT